MSRAPGGRGFTLIEVLMTVAITAIVMAAVGTILVGVLDAGKNIEETSRDEKAGYGILSVLRRDLAGAYGYALGGPAFKGEDESDSGRDADRLDFVTTADVLVDENGISPRLVEVGYRLKSATVEDRTVLVLYRRASPLSGDPLESDTEYTELYGFVEAFNLQYLDPETQDWVDSWEETTLPPAVKVELKLTPDEERKRAAEEEGVTLEPSTYTTVIGLPTRAEPAEDVAKPEDAGTQPPGAQ